MKLYVQNTKIIILFLLLYYTLSFFPNRRSTINQKNLLLKNFVTNVECCEVFCQRKNLHRCFCKKFDLLSPQQIIDSIDKKFKTPKKNCCCCESKAEVIKIGKKDDINLNLPMTEYDIHIKSLYVPPAIRNSLNKDIIVRTKIINPEKLLNNQTNEFSKIYEFNGL